MAKVTIKNGTPIGTESLCSRCVHGHRQKGFRESEELVFCTYVWDATRLVPFKVAECTSYCERDSMSIQQMREMALIINTSPTLKPAGFKFSDERVAVNSGETTIK
ncbi:hypothetical protein [Candidatus Korobacter versatilis]|nr:hypothetical protein [Candidatus Koribacter versatilis]